MYAGDASMGRGSPSAKVSSQGDMLAPNGKVQLQKFNLAHYIHIFRNVQSAMIIVFSVKQ